jgi:hypothetical protein
LSAAVKVARIGDESRLESRRRQMALRGEKRRKTLPPSAFFFMKVGRRSEKGDPFHV